jgi:Zn-dependent protease
MNWLTTKFSLGKYLRIPVYMHWAVLPMLAFFFWLGIMPGLAMTAAMVIVLLHEYGHALAARRFGSNTREILLTPIGGIAMIEPLKKPYHELLVALAGPAVNVAFIPILWALSYLHGFFWLMGLYNVVMLAFNMMPAFPLDGGVVVRSLLSMWWKNNYKATLVAGRIGQGFALLFGLVALLGGQAGLLLIALFMLLAAEKQIQQAKERQTLTDNVSEGLEILRQTQRNLTRRR